MPRRHNQPKPRLREVIAEGELRQEPDWDRFAWAVLQFVKLRREQAEAKACPEKPEPAK